MDDRPEPSRWPDATERRTLAGCALVGSIIALGPRELVSAGALFAIAVLLFAFHVWMSRKEEHAAGR